MEREKGYMSPCGSFGEYHVWGPLFILGIQVGRGKIRIYKREDRNCRIIPNNRTSAMLQLLPLVMCSVSLTPLRPLKGPEGALFSMFFTRFPEKKILAYLAHGF